MIMGENDIPTAPEALRQAVAYARGIAEAKDHENAKRNAEAGTLWLGIARELREAQQRRAIRDAELSVVEQQRRLADDMHRMSEAQIAAAAAVERSHNVSVGAQIKVDADELRRNLRLFGLRRDENPPAQDHFFGYVLGQQAPPTDTQFWAAQEYRQQRIPGSSSSALDAFTEEILDRGRQARADDTQQFTVPGHPDAAPVIANDLGLVERCAFCLDEIVGDQRDKYAFVHRNTGMRICHGHDSEDRGETYATPTTTPCEGCGGARCMVTFAEVTMDEGTNFLWHPVHVANMDNICPAPVSGS
jgi:hypothetical protein